MARSRLSTSKMEDHFLRCDEVVDRVVPKLAVHVRARFRSIAQTPRARGAFAAGLVHAAADWEQEARAATYERYIEPTPIVLKAGPRPSATEAELIDEAVAAGVELGLETFPPAIAEEIDVAAASRIARSRLRRAGFRRMLLDLENARAAMTRLSRATQGPATTVLRDGGALVQSFGLNDRQAAAIVRETEKLLTQGLTVPVVRRQMRRRIEQAIDFRSEMIARAIGNEAIEAGQDAVLEQAKRQGIIRAYRFRWVTREDKKVCPRCDRFAGKEANEGEPFESEPDENGDVEYADSTGIHPLCRCRREVIDVVWSTPRYERLAA